MFPHVAPSRPPCAGHHLRHTLAGGASGQPHSTRPVQPQHKHPPRPRRKPPAILCCAPHMHTSPGRVPTPAAAARTRHMASPTVRGAMAGRSASPARPLRTCAGSRGATLGRAGHDMAQLAGPIPAASWRRQGCQEVWTSVCWQPLMTNGRDAWTARSRVRRPCVQPLHDHDIPVDVLGAAK